MQVLNPKNKTTVKRAISWLTKYNQLDNMRNEAEANGDEKRYNQLDKQCQNAFDKFLEFMEELPKNQQQIIYNSDLY